MRFEARTVQPLNTTGKNSAMANSMEETPLCERDIRNVLLVGGLHLIYKRASREHSFCQIAQVLDCFRFREFC